MHKQLKGYSAVLKHGLYYELTAHINTFWVNENTQLSSSVTLMMWNSVIHFTGRFE